MKSLNLYIIVFITLVKTIATFSCDNVYIDKKTLTKATQQVAVEEKHILGPGTEYYTWYIDPCRELDKKIPNEGKNENERCPKNSRVCFVRSFEFNDDKKNKRVLEVKGYAVGNLPQDPVLRNGDYILNFEGEKDSDTSAEIIFTCAGKEGDLPEVELDGKKVTITYKGMCINEGKTSPTDGDDKDDDNEKKSGSSHFFIRFIFIIIICYFVIGMCYNFFVLNKSGVDIIPNVDLWLYIIGTLHEKITEALGRRNYQPLLS